ncbi:putative BAH domain, nucleotide-binding alpha-beta plait domain superfamily [Helianthus annuus]|nr:putative BAH domain, nucleotide-binding alpha-beta plait domain superfamily [Helianthus annuus]
MSTLEEEEENTTVSGDIAFRWGHKSRVGKKNPKIQYYESFTYDGVDYSLYDSVYLWSGDQHPPDIAKIIDIYETPRLKKMVKVVWYFRPTEVQKWLRGVRHLNNELFLASGEGNGLFNFNPLETICGKCNVVCKSKDERNPKASKEELKMSDYVFYRTFDVEKCILLDKFPDKIAGVYVERFFNPQPKGNDGVTSKSKSPLKCETDNTSTIVLGVPTSSSSDNNHSKKRTLQELDVDRTKIVEADSQSIMLKKRPNNHSKKRTLQELDVDRTKSVEADSQSIMLKKRPKLDTSEWFKKLPWEDRIHRARQAGCLVLLENLYHSFTSSQVEEIVMDAFNIKVNAKMIQWSAYSSPHNGQALVIFNSKDEADYAISELKTRCLIIGGSRVVVGSRPSLKEPGNHYPSKYFGHIAIDAMKQKHTMDMKNAVSTSHHSQPNTIAFEMAMEWWTHQKKWELCWEAMYKKHGEDIAKLKARLKGFKEK